MIPKLVHQTFRDRNLPEEIQLNIRNLTANNPGWRHFFYDDFDMFLFIRNHYGHRVLKAFNSINPLYGASRSDFFRYLLIYKVGGVYLDIKSSAARPLDSVTAGHQYLLSYWDNGSTGTHSGWGLHVPGSPRGEFQQWHIASIPEHPFLKRVIERVLHNIENYSPQRFGVGRMGILNTTGPIAYTESIMPMLRQHDHHFADTNHELGLVYSIYSDHWKSQLYDFRHPHYSCLSDPVVL
ncbi:glycosyltransferase family 32 protein [Burkholderia guangdongensis]|uniref:glycosyltransferase family 32 protein n=1 Tax=Burkholderia guangdongensis TaxID=1792500 RepID=UPI0015CB0803|nr:glycosyltransferase [Burkholderia guangdongensis]